MNTLVQLLTMCPNIDGHDAQSHRQIDGETDKIMPIAGHTG